MQVERVVTVKVRDGLHARPATQFVKLAKSFGSEIEIERGGKRANAKSSVKLMLLGIKEEDSVVLRADGEDADRALAELEAFIVSADAGMDVATGDTSPAPAAPVAAPAAPAASGTDGRPASRGTALGPVFAFFPEPILEAPRAVPAENRAAETEAYEAALEATVEALRLRRSDPQLRPDDAAILDALIDVARDVELTAAARGYIREGTDAVAAALRAGRELAESFEGVEDAYIRARAEDVRDITRRLALKLLGRTETSLAALEPGSVVAAEEIGAFDLAEADLKAIAGIVCRKGTVNSHVAIMARAHSIPLVVECAAPVAALRAARWIALDGATGKVELDPDETARGRIAERLAAEKAEREALLAYVSVEPVTRDGRRVEVAANLGTLKEIDAAKAAGAMGVGLLRTEFLFMERRTLPTEDEQADTYARFAAAFAPYPVVVRTLDVGGDKPVSGVAFPKEENPFLGWRGVRMCLERLDVFKPQLKALLRAATVGNIKVMVPMIVDASEIAAVRALVEECRAELDAEGKAHGRFDLGIMMETPAAALLAPEIAKAVDFFSIGTNDLTQYIMAADRLNPHVAKLNRADHPAVKRAVEMICRAAREAGIWVGVCGEAAADPALIPFFVANGVSELSMSPGSILKAKQRVTEL